MANTKNNRLLTDEEQDDCVPTRTELDAYMAGPDDGVAASITDARLKRQIGSRILYGVNIAEAQDAKTIKVLADCKQLPPVHIFFGDGVVDTLARQHDADQLVVAAKDVLITDLKKLVDILQQDKEDMGDRYDELKAQLKQKEAEITNLKAQLEEENKGYAELLENRSNNIMERVGIIKKLEAQLASLKETIKLLQFEAGIRDGKIKEQEALVKEAHWFIESFGKHRHLAVGDCAHCILLAKLKK
jgi:hypothetical protein